MISDLLCDVAGISYGHVAHDGSLFGGILCGGLLSIWLALVIFYIWIGKSVFTMGISDSPQDVLSLR